MNDIRIFTSVQVIHLPKDVDLSFTNDGRWVSLRLSSGLLGVTLSDPVETVVARLRGWADQIEASNAI